MVKAPILIECEGSGCPAHLLTMQTNAGTPLGICSMCGHGVETTAGIAVLHVRRDILAMLERGDYDEGGQEPMTNEP